MIDTIALRTAAAANLPALTAERDALRAAIAANREEHERMVDDLKAIEARHTLARRAAAAMAMTPEQVALAEATAAHAIAVADLELARAGADAKLIERAAAEEVGAREALARAQAAMPRGLTLLGPMLASAPSDTTDHTRDRTP
jgi:hypothetical protein